MDKKKMACKEERTLLLGQENKLRLENCVKCTYQSDCSSCNVYKQLNVIGDDLLFLSQERRFDQGFDFSYCVELRRYKGLIIAVCKRNGAFYAFTKEEWLIRENTGTPILNAKTFRGIMSRVMRRSGDV